MTKKKTSIGSTEKPAPSGTYRIRQVVKNPTYHYDPRFKFKGVRAHKKLTIAPGPNNPVGLVWIDLTKASYGLWHPWDAASGGDRQNAVAWLHPAYQLGRPGPR